MVHYMIPKLNSQVPTCLMNCKIMVILYFYAFGLNNGCGTKRYHKSKLVPFGFLSFFPSVLFGPLWFFPSVSFLRLFPTVPLMLILSAKIGNVSSTLGNIMSDTSLNVSIEFG